MTTGETPGSDMHVLALIPARQGSVAIPNKNVRMMAGRPLLAWSIAHALAARSVTRTIVSTDSEAYAAIAREYGAETPFLRPAELATDSSTDLEVFDHALRWLAEHEGYHPDICVHLRPTHPVRDPDDIDRMVQVLEANPGIDSIRSVVAAPVTPFKMWLRADDGRLSPVSHFSIPDAWNAPRQSLPKAYLQNAAIDVVRAGVILEKRSMTGQHIHGFVMRDMYDIDDAADFARVAAVLERQQP